MSNDFIIFIENKLRGNKETGGGTQTQRQWEALKNLGQNHSIQNLLGIFLTPEGKLPASKYFVPLSVRELVSAFKKVLEDRRESDHQPSIRAFLDLYDWYLTISPKSDMITAGRLSWRAPAPSFRDHRGLANCVISGGSARKDWADWIRSHQCKILREKYECRMNV